MKSRSIRFRLTAWYALVLTAGLGLFGALVWVSLYRQLLGDLDKELEGRASRFEAYFREEATNKTADQLRDELEEFSQAFAPTSSIEISGSNGFAFHHPAHAAARPAEVRTLRRLFSLNGDAFTLDLGVSTAEMDHTLTLLRSLLLGLIPVVTAIACFGGALLSRRALRPVTGLTEAARSISIENLSQRVPVSDTGDELSQLAETLNTMLARLESAVTMLSQFVADASHEFRTPLAVIQTTVELALRRPRDAGSYRESLVAVGDEVTRMTHLVEDLLALARSDTAAVDMPRDVLDVRNVLHDVIAEARPLADRRQIRIAPLSNGDAAWIAGNRAALHRLFLVLIDNALKFSHPGGQVDVTVRLQDQIIAVTVIDHGVGIPTGQIPHLFERFYRGDPARAAGGHGLGLALADSIVRAHSARIAVESVEGMSTEFRVEFEARRAPADSLSSSKAPTV